MDNYIESYIKSIYGFDINNCSKEELLKITQINARDVTGIRQYDEKFDWDFSKLTNLKTIDCSYNTIDSIDISQNILLEEICWMGVRGKLSKPIDLSHNVNLKKIVGGQDGLIKLDLSNNTKLEEIMILNSLSLRWINLDNCLNLKKIIMNGVNIPFVDLTNCSNLEYCEIHYWNLYRNKRNEYGNGYPRPILFVQEDFNEDIIPAGIRSISNYTYYLVRTGPNSAERQFLDYLKANEKMFTSIPPNIYGHQVARMHYQLLDELRNYIIEK